MSTHVCYVDKTSGDVWLMDLIPVSLICNLNTYLCTSFFTFSFLRVFSVFVVDEEKTPN